MADVKKGAEKAKEDLNAVADFFETKPKSVLRYIGYLAIVALIIGITYLVFR